MAQPMVKQPVEGEEVSTEILATNIIAISTGIKKMRAGRLNDRALILLIHDASGVGKPAIRDVLNTLESLETIYCKKKAVIR